jgi:hypothetical protein
VEGVAAAAQGFVVVENLFGAGDVARRAFDFDGSDFRSMETFSPSSSKCRFSSLVPNRVSRLGLISIFFFI